MLIAFVVSQLVVDVVLILVAVRLVRRATPGHAPPPWYPEFLRLAEDLLEITEPVLAAIESSPPDPFPVAPPPPPAEAPPERSSPSARYRLAFSLLRAGRRPEEVARRGQLLPRELRLIESLVAAESRLSSRGT